MMTAIYWLHVTFPACETANTWLSWLLDKKKAWINWICWSSQIVIFNIFSHHTDDNVWRPYVFNFSSLLFFENFEDYRQRVKNGKIM